MTSDVHSKYTTHSTQATFNKFFFWHYCYSIFFSSFCAVHRLLPPLGHAMKCRDKLAPNDYADLQTTSLDLIYSDKYRKTKNIEKRHLSNLLRKVSFSNKLLFWIIGLGSFIRVSEIAGSYRPPRPALSRCDRQQFSGGRVVYCFII